MQLSVGKREISLKVVYYGPPLSGKTTNLQAIHKMLDPSVCGRMTTLNTADDRTLFFDLLPVIYHKEADYRVKLKLYTVPGQVIHGATRRVVLSGADGVIFVASSQVDEASVNNEYWHGMRHYLTQTGVDSAAIPTVIQFNKRDLPGSHSAEALAKIRSHSPEPVFEAVAIRGVGVLDTLRGLLSLMIADLDKRYGLAEKFGIETGSFLDALFENAREPSDEPIVHESRR